MRETITEEDEHNPVFDQEEERVGTVPSVEDSTLYIDFEPKTRDVVMRSPGIESVDEEHTPPIDDEMSNVVTDDQIRLRETIRLYYQPYY